MSAKIIGRATEQALLKQVLTSAEAELVAVIGRRRVGKTFLVNTVYEKHLVFDLTGTQNGDTALQLQHFADQLEAYARPFSPVKRPLNWEAAFKRLRQYLETCIAESPNEKKVVFFDELPWLAGKKSGFLDALGYFWNSWAGRRPELVIVICGSAASWMIQRVVNDRGGLHNRITRRIFLQPFTLAEAEAFLRSRNVMLDRYQLVQLYMAMGGIPHYLKEIQPGQSAVQNIERICFSRQGILSDEFERLYPSLFAHAERHISVVRTLAGRRSGMTRGSIAEATGLPNGGGLTKVLEELAQSGFIAETFPFGKKKREKIYRLVDEYSLFFLQFIEQHRYQGGNVWQLLSQTPGYRSWSGYAFESVCLKHLPQIKNALGIAGVYSLASSFLKKGTKEEEGVQIDLVLDRNDHIINLFEIKFYNQPFSLSKEQADKLRRAMWTFQRETKTRKQVQWVLISTYGLAQNQHSTGLVFRALTVEELFG